MEANRIRINLGSRAYSIVSCSVMGAGKIENQDSIKIHCDDNQIVIVIADGLGSAIYSKEGSQKITSIATNIISEKRDLSEIAHEIQMEWKTGLQGNLNMYDTTVKFIKITEKDVFYGGVGDGWIAFNTTNGFTDVTSSNTFSNQTDTILSFDLKNKFYIERIDTDSLITALISTDGFSEDMDKENGDAFLSAVSEQMRADSKLFQKEIEDTLSHWPVETNRDDKTVVFIERE